MTAKRKKRATFVDTAAWETQEAGGERGFREAAAAFASEEERQLAQVQSLFGGRRALGRTVESQLDLHKLLDEGLSAKAFLHFIQKSVQHVPRAALLKAIGMSERTYQRVADKPISADQSGRAWRLAEILVQANRVFGSWEHAERWLESLALGLDRQRPIDLVTTAAGAKLVGDFLMRLKYGVYT